MNNEYVYMLIMYLDYVCENHMQNGWKLKEPIKDMKQDPPMRLGGQPTWSSQSLTPSSPYSSREHSWSTMDLPMLISKLALLIHVELDNAKLLMVLFRPHDLW